MDKKIPHSWAVRENPKVKAMNNIFAVTFSQSIITLFLNDVDSYITYFA